MAPAGRCEVTLFEAAEFGPLRSWHRRARATTRNVEEGAQAFTDTRPCCAIDTPLTRRADAGVNDGRRANTATGGRPAIVDSRVVTRAAAPGTVL